MGPTRDLLIGIDIGTTNLKAVAIRPGGRVEAVARRPMGVRHPRHGWSEFDLDSLDRDLIAVLAELTAEVIRLGPVSIHGIGVASFGESFVGLGAAGRRVTPCPTWFDRRTRNGRASLGLSPEAWFDITGMVDDDIYTVHRLRWWRDAAPDWFARVATWLMVADYVTAVLCGMRVASPSLAARSGMADRVTGGWSREILDRAGISITMLPELRPAAAAAGPLRAEVAAATGLPAGTPVVNAGHDHPCAGLGCGLADPGPVIDSTGTSEALKTVVSRPLRYAEVSNGAYDCYPHVVPDRFLLSGHISSSGSVIDWLVRLLSGPAGDPGASVALWDDAARMPPGSDGLRFAPFLSGTGAPWNDRTRRGSIHGIDGDATGGTLLRAALESLSGWLAINLSAFEAITGETAAEIIVTGAGARNELANTIKAAVLSRTLRMPGVEEAAATGAALVAGLAGGIFATAAQAARLPDMVSHEIKPEPLLVDEYRTVSPPLTHAFEGFRNA